MEEVVLILETNKGFNQITTTLDKVTGILNSIGDLKSWQVKNRYYNSTPDIIRTLDREYRHMEEKGWDRIFLMFDLHGTVIKPNRIVGNTDIEYYPFAKETLQLISNRSDLDLNIYTCSHEHEIVEYQRKFKEDGIIFKYVNENPDVKTSGYGNYDKKPYMNVLFEDKAGFLGETDWKPVYEYFMKKYIKD